MKLRMLSFQDDGILARRIKEEEFPELSYGIRMISLGFCWIF